MRLLGVFCNTSIASQAPEVKALCGIIWLNKAIFYTQNSLILSRFLERATHSPAIA